MRECDHTADIYLKNGHQFTVESSGLWDHLVPLKEKTVLNSLYGMSVARPLPDWDPEILREEIQDLKLENDRLAKRNDKMRQVIRSIACDPDCEFCLLRGSECSGSDMQHLAAQTLKELEDL